MDKKYKSINGQYDVYVSEFAEEMYQRKEGYVFAFFFGAIGEIHFRGAPDSEGTYSPPNMVARFKIKAKQPKVEIDLPVELYTEIFSN